MPNPALIRGALLSAFFVCTIIGLWGSEDQIEESEFHFQIPQGQARENLQLAAKQSGIQIIFSDVFVEGVITNALHGYYTPSRALYLMLEGTGLSFVQAKANGAFAISKSEPELSESMSDDSELQNETYTMEMKNPKTINSTRKAEQSFLATLAAVLVTTFTTPLEAQTEEDTEDVLLLSPFVVETTEEMGYFATNTLAGTRIKTQLSDLPNSIVVATQELMSDLDVNNPSELLPFLGNIETGGPDGSYGGGDGVATITFTSQNRNPQNANRIRGLARADNTRNYLPTGIVYDGYNVERVAVNRGPNSTLFGLGSPGGIINHQTIQARLNRDAYKFSARIGSFNNYRANFDINKVVIDDMLAVRVAGVYQDREWRQDPSYSKTQRGTVAVTFNPLEGVTFRASYERGEVDARRPRPNAPRDTFTRWWHPAFNKVTHDPANIEFGRIDRDIVRAPGEWFGQPGYQIDGNTGEVLYSARAWETTFPGGGRRFRTHQVSITKGEQWYQSPTAAANGIEFGSFWGDEELLDRSVFDWVENMLDGPNKNEWETFDVFNFSMEQIFTFDWGSAGYEFTYSNERIERSWFDMFQGARGYNINIDINTTTNWGDPNPNFGRPFIAAQNQRQTNIGEREVSRGTAFFEIDFKNAETQWINWFGRHSGTVFAQTFMRDTNSYSARNHGDVDFAQTVIGNTDLNGGPTNMRTRVWVGDSFANASGPQGGNIYGVRDTITPQPVTHYYYDRPSDTWLNYTHTPVFVGPDYDDNFWNSIHGKTVNRQITDSYAYVHQAYLFDTEWIVGTFGYRKDRVKSFASNTPRNEFDFIDLEELRLNEEVSEEPFEAITRSYGLVVHTPDFVPLPDGIDISFHWGESENFQIASPSIDIFGNLLTPPGGTTEDYGFTINLLDGKFVIRYNEFETTSDNVRAGYPGFLTETDRRIIRYNSPEAIAASGYQGPPQFYKDLTGWRIVEGNTESGFNVQQDGAPFALNDTQSTLSKGREIDMIFNPTSNWRISWNIAQQEAVRSNLLPATREYLTYRFDEWTDTTPGGPGFLIADESDQPVNIRVYDTLLNTLNANLARDGQLVPELREWRTNVITNYRFADDSKFKGFNVGGAYRWEDEKAIGYPVKVAEIDGQQVEIFDLDNPYTDDAITRVDLWVGYKRKIWDGKIDWALQLNIRNALSDGEVVAVGTQPDGSVRSAIWREGRTWTLRSTFSF